MRDETLRSAQRDTRETQNFVKPRQLITFIISLIITGVFLYLALNQVDFGKLGNALASADYRLVILGMCFSFTNYVLRAVRWQRFLAPTKLIPSTSPEKSLVIAIE